MYETLFEIEADLKKVYELANANPLLVSVSDSRALKEILERVVNKANKAVVAGAQRPNDEPMPFVIV